MQNEIIRPELCKLASRKKLFADIILYYYSESNLIKSENTTKAKARRTQTTSRAASRERKVYME
jgi:hypothetical protein